MSGQCKELIRLAAIPRGRDEEEELRISLDEFEPDGGKPAKYVSARVWYLDDSVWKPSKKGITFRRSELDTVIASLEKARRAIHSKEQPVPVVRRPEPECATPDGELF